MRKSLPLLFAMAICASSAHAGLGGSPATLESANTKIRARALKQTAATYSVIETTLDSGTGVREYVSTGGIVFAVSWQGPFIPDLNALLGDHYQTMLTETSKNPRASRTRMSINRSDVVIRGSGRMRAWRGRAWIPGALPAGFASDDIR